MQPESAATVSLIDDDESARAILAEALTSTGIAVRPFSSSVEFFAEMLGDRPGCLVVESRQLKDGLATWLASCKLRGMRAPVIITSAHADVPLVLDAWKHGIRLFLTKPYELPEIVQQIREIVAEDHEFRLQLAMWQQTHQRLAKLTDKERTVLNLILDAMPNKGMAVQLGISERAIEMRRAAIMRKLNVHSLVELIRLVTQHDFISRDRRFQPR